MDDFRRLAKRIVGTTGSVVFYDQGDIPENQLLAAGDAGLPIQSAQNSNILDFYNESPHELST